MRRHPDLFDAPVVPRLPLPSPPKAQAFNGPDYVLDRDHDRLRGQILRVFGLMKDGRWRTLDQISQQTEDPPASISAQLRHLRKKRFGGHTVERQNIGGGLNQYRLVVNQDA